jgi:hypothetical protein
MVARKRRSIRPTMEQARQRFEHWRKTCQPRSPIPEALWALAVEAAREQGVNPTALFLRLNYSALKRRVNSAERTGRHRERRARFVELAAPRSLLSPCTIELESAQGAKMRIHLASPEKVDWVSLSRSLWSAAS